MFFKEFNHFFRDPVPDDSSSGTSDIYIEYTSSKQRNREKKFLKEKHFVPDKDNPKRGMIDSTEIDPKTGKPIRVSFAFDKDPYSNSSAFAASGGDFIHMDERELQKHPDISRSTFAHEDGHLILNRDPKKSEEALKRVTNEIQKSDLGKLMNDHGNSAAEYIADRNSLYKVGYDQTVRMLKHLRDDTALYNRSKKSINKDPYKYALSSFCGSTNLKDLPKEAQILVGFMSLEKTWEASIKIYENNIKEKISFKHQLIRDKKYNASIGKFIDSKIEKYRNDIDDLKTQIAKSKDERRALHQKFINGIKASYSDEAKLKKELIDGIDELEKQNRVELDFRIKMLSFWNENKTVSESYGPEEDYTTGTCEFDEPYNDDPDDCYCESADVSNVDIALLTSPKTIELCKKYRKYGLPWFYYNAETRKEFGELPDNIVDNYFKLIGILLTKNEIDYNTYKKYLDVLYKMHGIPSEACIKSTDTIRNTSFSDGKKDSILKFGVSDGKLPYSDNVRLFHTSSTPNLTSLNPRFRSRKPGEHRSRKPGEHIEALFPSPRVYFGYNAICSRFGGGIPIESVNEDYFKKNTGHLYEYVGPKDYITAIYKDPELGGNAVYVETTRDLPVKEIKSFEEFKNGMRTVTESYEPLSEFDESMIDDPDDCYCESVIRTNGVYTNGGSIEKINDFPFKKVYFGSPNKMPSTMKLDGPLFVTPYAGIASIFAVRPQDVHKYGVPRGVDFNRDYDEWKLPTDKLNKILKELHVWIEGKGINIKPATENVSGYVYTIDVSPEIKDHIYQSSKMNKEKEFCIDKIDSITFSNMEKIDVFMTVDSRESKTVQEGYIQESKMPAKKRNQLENGDFGLVYKDANGKTIRKYPLNDKAHVASAARLFGHCPDKYKKRLANKILRKAHEYGMDTSGWDTVNKAAKG